MFVNAIEKVGAFTRPVFAISRKYGSFDVKPGAATLFFVNDEGWALTCGHVAKMIIDAGGIEKKYADFKIQRDGLLTANDLSFEAPGLITSSNCDEAVRETLAGLESSFGYTPDTVCQLKINFIDCVDYITTFDVKISKEFDIALIHFHGWQKLGYRGHAVFASADTAAANLKQGKMLCRLGYPFPEFKNFKYDQAIDNTAWVKEGLQTSPRFPVRGMVTRLMGANGKIAGIEMDTQGHFGMDGAPLFDADGKIYGMHVGPALHGLGQCIHVDTIKAFMQQEGVKFYEDNGPGGSGSSGSSSTGSDKKIILDPAFFTSGGNGKVN